MKTLVEEKVFSQSVDSCEPRIWTIRKFSNGLITADCECHEASNTPAIRVTYKGNGEIRFKVFDKEGNNEALNQRHLGRAANLLKSVIEQLY